MAHLLGAQAIGLEYPDSVVLDPSAAAYRAELTAFFEVAAGRRKPFMRLWEWNGPQVVIGSFQSYQNEIQQDGVDLLTGIVWSNLAMAVVPAAAEVRVRAAEPEVSEGMSRG